MSRIRSRLAAVAGVMLLLVGTLVAQAVAPSQASALTTCFSDISPLSNYQYAIADTSCNLANAARVTITNGTSAFDTGPTADHVLDGLWVFTGDASEPTVLEDGFFYGYICTTIEASSGCSLASRHWCNYVDDQGPSGYYFGCGQVLTGPPSSAQSFSITYQGSGFWDAWVGSTLMWASIDQEYNTANWIYSGAEQESDEGTFTNLSPVGLISSPQYSSGACGLTCISYQAWTQYTTCFVQSHMAFGGNSPFPVSWYEATNRTNRTDNCTGNGTNYTLGHW